MNNWFKRNSMHFAVAGIFLVICLFYFTPAFEGKVLGQSDVVGAESTQKEINDYKAKDTTILWTNQIFGGMPTFQIWAPYNANATTWIVKTITAIFPNPIYTVLILLLGTYFLFIVLKLNPWLAAAGALAFTFTSYNIILLVAGHTNQAFAIAFFAPLLASLILTLRGRYWLGGSLTALFLAMEIRANHVQMTYYLLLSVLILLAIELYHAIKDKKIAAFAKSIAFIGGAVLIGLAVNASLLWSTYEYGQDTIRGKSNLSQHTTEPSDGLARDYAYQYSQGVQESFTFLVPNASGGGSVTETPDPKSATAKIFTDKGATDDQAINAVQQIGSFPGLSLYWGDKRPSTYGPYYFGAVICFLFVLGLIIVKNRLKWWLLGTVVLTMLLSFGGNFPFLSDLFFNHFPLYNKFRTVESILAVTGLCFPILALLALQQVITEPDKAAIWKSLKLAFYITGGLLLILIVIPSVLLSFKPHDQDASITSLVQAMKGDTETANSVGFALIKDRTSLEQADAIRSLIFVLIAFGILWAFVKQKVSAAQLSIAFLALILVDLWSVDKRYLKDENFADKQESVIPPMRPVDQEINQDTDPDYRVVDLTQSPKYDLSTSFYHKAIWGYSAARLKRYDEVIDNQFSKTVNISVLDMLNTKYIITGDQKTQALSVQKNPGACGHAWFVKSIKYVANADEEMQAITSFTPKDTAIVDQQYKALVSNSPSATDTTATIKLTSYSPDHMVYQTQSPAPQIAVFSEIYYNKGWKMLIDGKEQPYFRADYLLRAAAIPAGNHKVDFIFHPASYYTGEDISLAGSILLFVALGGAAYAENRKKKS